jgi:hypothetical protein
MSERLLSRLPNDDDDDDDEADAGLLGDATLFKLDGDSPCRSKPARGVLERRDRSPTVEDANRGYVEVDEEEEEGGFSSSDL